MAEISSRALTPALGQIVISDATPINILIRIGYIDILTSLFGVVLVPPAVIFELTQPETPAAVNEWATHRPDWLQVRTPAAVVLPGRGKGEREAIALAVELGADYLLADDRQARATATRQGITVIGTLGLLEVADQRNILSLPDAIATLQSTDFLIAQPLIDAALKRRDSRSAPSGEAT